MARLVDPPRRQPPAVQPLSLESVQRGGSNRPYTPQSRLPRPLPSRPGTAPAASRRHPTQGLTPIRRQPLWVPPLRSGTHAPYHVEGARRIAAERRGLNSLPPLWDIFLADQDEPFAAEEAEEAEPSAAPPQARTGRRKSYADAPVVKRRSWVPADHKNNPARPSNRYQQAIEHAERFFSSQYKARLRLWYKTFKQQDPRRTPALTTRTAKPTVVSRTCVPPTYRPHDCVVASFRLAFPELSVPS